MSTKPSIQLGVAWSLIYDASVDGPFTGSLSMSTGVSAQIFVGPDAVAPAANVSGLLINTAVNP